jgi:hypothetical protein
MARTWLDRSWMNSGQTSALSPDWAGWISFHRSQAKIAPDPPQRSTMKVSRFLIAARVPGQVSISDGCGQVPPFTWA